MKGVYSTIPQANRLLCSFSLLIYVTIWIKACFHFMDALNSSISIQKLRIDALFLASIYALETFIALVLNKSTLYRWRMIDFIVHHIPVIIGCVGLYYNPMLMNYTKYTAITVFSISLNEAVMSAQSMNVKMKPNIACMYRVCMITIIIMLICSETIEGAQLLLFDIKHELGFSRFWAIICFCVIFPYYHLFVVLPYNYRQLIKAMDLL